MKSILSLILIFSFSQSFAQTKKPATKQAQPSQSQLVKNHVVSKTKGSLELPKYFKLEKATAEILNKGGYKPLSIGINEIDPIDTLYKKKVLVLEEEDEYSLGIYKSYNIDSVEHIGQAYFFYLKGEPSPYVFYNTSTNFKVYEKAVQDKIYIDRSYSTKIIFWAMSNGGQVRMYTDYGVVYIDKAGKMRYEVLED
jgi:hypothetical protein